MKTTANNPLAMTLKDRQAQSLQQWRVDRNGGRSTDEWKMKRAGTETECRIEYDKLVTAMRQGGVRLVNPEGRVVVMKTAPRLTERLCLND